VIPIEVSSTKASTLRSDAMLPVGPINFILFEANLQYAWIITMQMVGHMAGEAPLT
jgi:hypothetical protein